LVSAALQWQEVLNVRNRAGDVPLHIIGQNIIAPASLIERFIVAGADLSLVTSVCIQFLNLVHIHSFYCLLSTVINKYVQYLEKLLHVGSGA